MRPDDFIPDMSPSATASATATATATSWRRCRTSDAMLAMRATRTQLRHLFVLQARMLSHFHSQTQTPSADHRAPDIVHGVVVLVFDGGWRLRRISHRRGSRICLEDGALVDVGQVSDAPLAGFDADELAAATFEAAFFRTERGNPPLTVREVVTCFQRALFATATLEMPENKVADLLRLAERIVAASKPPYPPMPFHEMCMPPLPSDTRASVEHRRSVLAALDPTAALAVAEKLRPYDEDAEDVDRATWIIYCDCAADADCAHHWEPLFRLLSV